MSLTRARPSRGQRGVRRRTVVVAAGTVVVLIAMLLVALFVPSRGHKHASAAAVTRYEKAILGPVKDWGSVEILGMRPSIPDLLGAKGALPASAVIAESKAWVAAFAHDRSLIAAAQPPKGLGPCRALMLQALDKYTEAARAFGQAAATPPAQRRPVIQVGITSATAGDTLFNRASAVLQQARRDAGLPPSPDFPQSK